MAKPIDLKSAVAELKTFYKSRRRLPSFSEIQRLLGYRSKGGVSNLISHLVRKNILGRDKNGKLIPTAAFEGGLKLVGSIQAGWPSPAEEELVDTLSLNEFLVQNPEASYLVKVTGDSMIEAGIMPNDLVIVDRRRQPKPGDIVIAQVDGEWTMKYFIKRGGKVMLKAANKKYQPIQPKEELVIAGVVIANVRKYK
ncbi:MAG: repressor LexA [Candidatus Omnitrophica bacterium]|nr:repressor LexA [Candidatus Omnitrophota bacterium]